MARDNIDSNVRKRRLSDVTQTAHGEMQRTINNNVDKADNDVDKETSSEFETKLSLWRAPMHDGKEFIPQIRWPDLMAQIFLHIGAIYGLLFHFWKLKFYTYIWCK